MEVADRRRLDDWHELGQTPSPSGYESAVALLIFNMVEQLAERSAEGIVVAETGVRYGFMAKRLPDFFTINDIAWFFVPDMDLRNLLHGDAFFMDNLQVCVKDTPIIDPIYTAATDLLIVNSDEPDCWAEITTWLSQGKRDSYLILPRTTHKTQALLKLLQVSGVDLGNPARTFVARRNDPLPRLALHIWSRLLERSPKNVVG